MLLFSKGFSQFPIKPTVWFTSIDCVENFLFSEDFSGDEAGILILNDVWSEEPLKSKMMLENNDR